MTYIQVIWNGESTILHPTEEIPVRIDISTIENGEIGEIFGDLSQSFNIAGTPEANKFFNDAFVVGGQLIPGVASKAECSLNTENETILYGSLVLERWNEDTNEYICRIVSGVGDLSSTLSDSLIRDADWSALQHTYTMDHALAQNTSSTLPPYYYPLVDFGYDSGGRPRVPDDVELPNVAASATYNPAVNYYNTNYYQSTYNSGGFDEHPAQTNSLVQPSIYFGEMGQGNVAQGYITHPMTPLRIDQLLPAIQLRQVVDRIFEQAGATYEGSFINNVADAYILPKAHDGLGFDGEFVDDKGFITTTTGTYTIPEINVNNRAAKDSGNNTIWTYGTGFTVTESYDPGNNFTGNSYRAPETGTYEFSFNAGFDNLSGRTDNFFNNAYWNARVSILVGNREVKSIDLPRIGNNADFNGGDRFDVELLTGDILVYEGQMVTARLISGPSRGADDLSFDVIAPNFRATKTPLTFDGSTINPGLQFGEAKSIDILNAIIRKYNLVIAQDKQRQNHYHITQYYDWILQGNRVDWSDRVTSLQHKGVLDELEDTLTFTDSEDDDRLNKYTQDTLIDTIYGQRIYRSTSDIPTGDKTIGDFFGPLVVGSIGQAGDVTKGVRPDVINGIPHLYEYSIEDGAESMQPKMRIGYRKQITLTSDIYYANSDNNVVKHTGRSFLTLSNIDQKGNSDLNYSDNFNYSNVSASSAYEKYWSQYINHLYRPGARKIICDVRFSPSDFQTLNINDTVHIFGNDYLINRINGFNTSAPDIVSVELITYDNNFVNVFEEPTNRFIEDDSDSRTHIVGLQARGYDGDPATADILPESIEVSVNFLEAEGDPTETETFTVSFATNTDVYDLSASNFTSNAGSLTGVTVGAFTDNATTQTVECEVTIEIGASHQYSYLIFQSEVDPLIAGTNSITIDFTEMIGEATIQPDPITVQGQPGSTQYVQTFVAPTQGFQLNATSFATGTLPLNVSNVSFQQVGFSVLVAFSVEIPAAIGITRMLEITGDDATAVPVGTNVSTLTLVTTESTTNLSVYPTSQRIQGVAGTGGDIQILVESASGYSLDHNTVTGNDGGSAFTTIGNAIQNGDDVILPITYILPGTNGAAETSTVSITGSPVQVGGPSKDITITFAGVTSDFTINQSSSEVLTMPLPGSLEFSVEVIPAVGKRIVSMGATTSSDTAVVEVISTDDAGGGNMVVTLRIKSTVAAGNAATISFNSVVVADEPYQAVINVSETLPQGRLATSTLTQRFSSNDINLVFTGVRVVPNEGRLEYPSSTTFTITGGVASNYAYSNGEVSFTLTVPLPAFNSGNPIGDVSLDVSIGAAAAPESSPATQGEFTVDTFEIPRTGGFFSIGFTSNGRPSFLISSSPSTYNASVSWLASAVASYSNVELTSGKVGHSGGIFSNGTGSDRTAYLLMTPANATTPILDSVAITQRGTNDVTSPDVTGLDVNIGGTPGSTNGILYIT